MMQMGGKGWSHIRAGGA